MTIDLSKCAEVRFGLARIKRLDNRSYGSSKAENDSFDRAASRLVVEVNWRKTGHWKSALHDAHNEGPQNGARENDAGSLFPI